MAAASGKKENIYGPVKAFSYLTGAAAHDKSDTPSGVLRKDEGLYGSREDLTRGRQRDPYGSQPSNLDRYGQYVPDRETGQTDYYTDQRNGSGYAGFVAPRETDSSLGYNPQGQQDGYGKSSGYSNSGYMDSPASARRAAPAASSHRDLREKERHPKSPESHPTLFDNFILKGPGRDSKVPDEVESRDSMPNAETGAGKLQHLFQDSIYPKGHRKDDRNTKHSSQASSTTALIQDRSSSSASESGKPYREPFRVHPGTGSDVGISVDQEPPYNYGRKLPRIDATPISHSTSGLSYGENPQAETQLHHPSNHYHQPARQPPPPRTQDYIHQVHPNDKTKASPTEPRFRTQEADFGRMTSYDDSGEENRRRHFICTAVTVTLVVALICLGVGFVAGWFGYKMARENQDIAADTTTAFPTEGGAFSTTSSPSALASTGVSTVAMETASAFTTSSSNESTTL